jgi:antitoxin component YwqK of YwqJK toxin-antitoxin module
MKTIPAYVLIVIFFFSGSGCLNKRTPKTPDQNQTDTLAASKSDTGYTGIKQYFSKSYLVKEVTFKNGIRQGLMKTYYLNGKLYQTFWYENGMREDTAKRYFEDGKIYRVTPYKRDTMDGTQIQYYKNGKVRARLNFVAGSRTPFLEEFLQNGSKVSGYPEIVINIQDDYGRNGTYKISLELNKKDVKVSFYSGEYIDGLFMPKKYIKLNTTDYKGYLGLKKTGKTGKSYVGIIAEISTELGNKYLTYKKIDLPYNDLN